MDRVEVVRNGRIIQTIGPEDPGNADTIRSSWEDAEPVSANTYYYLRAFQLDGEMAWTSPIWVDIKGGADD